MKATLSAVALLIAISLPIMAQRTLPSDPLTKEENERLVNVATQYAISTQRLPRERSQWAVVGTELVDFKAPVRTNAEPNPEQAGRYGPVIFFNYEKNEGVRAIVDLNRNAGVSLARITPQATPVGREEIERAVKLALAAPAVTRVLGDRAQRFVVAEPGSNEENVVEGLRVLGSGPDDRCSVQRCVDLFFRIGGSYLTGTRFTVNLSSGVVRVTTTTTTTTTTRPGVRP